MERMIISFLEKDQLHNNASSYYDEKDNEKTVYEIAVELEEKYHVISKFIDRYRDDITLKIAKERFTAEFKEGYNADLEIAEYIQGLWLDFMENGEHGIMSVRAKEEGGVGLIDTGEYYQSMVIKVNDTYSRGDF